MECRKWQGCFLKMHVLLIETGSYIIGAENKSVRRSRRKVNEGRVFLTAQQVADELDIPVRTVFVYIKEGLIPAMQLGRTYRVSRQALDQLGLRQE